MDGNDGGSSAVIAVTDAPLIDDQRAIYGSLAKLGVLRDDKMISGDSR